MMRKVVSDASTSKGPPPPANLQNNHTRIIRSASDLLKNGMVAVRKKEPLFKPYLSDDEAKRLISEKLLIKGQLRINARNYEEAYVSDPVDENIDIFIKGIFDRNRALHGDIVAIELVGLEDTDDGVQKIGRVTYILEKKHTRLACGYLKPMKDQNSNWALFSPNDSRVPRLMIPARECPNLFMQRPQDFERMLFVARMIDWNESSKFARGSLCKSLGEAGEIEPETEGMLMEYGIDSGEFPPEVLACLPVIPNGCTWQIPPNEYEYREDFREELLFTIDPATARDLDDALHVKKIDESFYEVGVHIADVSYFVKLYTELDKSAKNRATSVYLVHKVIPMLPRLLCEELCSLNPGVDRLAFSVIWKMNTKGVIYSERFTRSVIRSCAKLNYDVAQGFITEPHRDWKREELPPISGTTWTAHHICEAVNVLHQMALAMRARRHDSGALRLDQPKLSFSLDKETGYPNGCTIYRLKDSNRLIEEFMLLANMAVAHRIYKFYPQVAVLRRHPQPKTKVMRDVVRLCKQHGYELDPATTTTLQISLSKYKGESEQALAVWAVLMQLIMKPMKLAVYFCSGSLDDESEYHHYALNVPLYTHFTSPIRRYPDIMVHRLLAATLDYDTVPDWPVELIEKITDHCNHQKWSAKAVSDLSSEMFFSIFIRKCGPLEEKAVIVGIMDHSFDVVIPKFGLTKRIYCNKLKEVALWDFKGDKEKAIGSMTLTLNSGKSRTLNIFDYVEVILVGIQDSLKYEAVLKLQPENSE